MEHFANLNYFILQLLCSVPSCQIAVIWILSVACGATLFSPTFQLHLSVPSLLLSCNFDMFVFQGHEVKVKYVENVIFYTVFAFCMCVMVVCLNGQGHFKIKVKVTQCQIISRSNYKMYFLSILNAIVIYVFSHF